MRVLKMLGTPPRWMLIAVSALFLWETPPFSVPPGLDLEGVALLIYHIVSFPGGLAAGLLGLALWAAMSSTPLGRHSVRWLCLKTA